MPYRNHIDQSRMQPPVGQHPESPQWDARIQQYVDPRTGIPVNVQQQMLPPDPRAQRFADPRMMPAPQPMQQPQPQWDPRTGQFVQPQLAPAPTHAMGARGGQPAVAWGKPDGTVPTEDTSGRRRRSRPAPFEVLEREPEPRRARNRPENTRKELPVEPVEVVSIDINIKMEKVKMDNEEVLPPVPDNNVLGDSTYAWLKHSIGDNSGAFAMVDTGYYFHVDGNPKTFDGPSLTRDEMVGTLANMVREGNPAAIKLDAILTKAFQLLYNAMGREHLGIESLVCDYSELVTCSEDMISRDANVLCRVMDDLLDYAMNARSEYSAEESTLTLIIPETYGVVKDATALNRFVDGKSDTLTTDSSAIAYTGEDSVRFSYLLTDRMKLGIYADKESGKCVMYKL